MGKRLEFLAYLQRQYTIIENQLTDHLGNVRALVGRTGGTPDLKGVNDYYPFGMVMSGRDLQSAEGYRYTYQGQEKDPETGKEAFELRLWDARIGRWLTTDPMHEFASPYLGMGNNPLNKIDPDGGSTAEPLDDYKLNKDGSIELIKLTDDKFDRLFANKGTDTESVIKVDKGILNKMGTFKNSAGDAFKYLKLSNRTDAKKLFEFVAQGSEVEWSKVDVGTISSFLSTGGKPTSDPSAPALINYLYNGGYAIKSHTHSHPFLITFSDDFRRVTTYGDNYPSGFNADGTIDTDYKGGDRAFATSVLKHIHGVKFYVYSKPGFEYIRYDSTKVYPAVDQ